LHGRRQQNGNRGHQHEPDQIPFRLSIFRKAINVHEGTPDLRNRWKTCRNGQKPVDKE
jgi:hypothetical protein